MGKKCFFVDENLRCPHCRKKIGEKELRKADQEFNRDIEKKAGGHNGKKTGFKEL